MAQFTLNWDNTPIINLPNILNQRASYRPKTAGGNYITTGFLPVNDMAKTVIQAVIDGLSNNIVYQFRIDSVCTVNGPTVNANGVQEGIAFTCLVPTITNTDIGSTIVLNVAGTDIIKARFTLKRTSDNAVMLADTIVDKIGTTITGIKATGLTASTMYYWQYDLYAVVNGAEVISSGSQYLNSKCTPYSFLTGTTSTVCAVINSVTATNITGTSGTDGTTVITINSTPSNGIFKFSLDNNTLIAVTSNPFTLSNLNAGSHGIVIRSFESDLTTTCSQNDVAWTVPAIQPCAPVCPTNVTIATPYPNASPSQNGGSIITSWTKDNCADQYKLLITRVDNNAFVQSAGPNAASGFPYDSNTNKYSYPSTNLIPGVQYKVLVTAFKNGTETANCTGVNVTVVADCVPAAITVQPVSVSVNSGAYIDMSVTATGTGLTYQWQVYDANTQQWKNINGQGGTTANLHLLTSGSAEAGDYRVRVTGTCGAVVISTTAVATVSTLSYQWDWTDTNPYVNDSTAPSFNVTGSAALISGDPLYPNFTGAAGAYKYFLVRFPATEPNKTLWADGKSATVPSQNNAPFNNGQIPDADFRAIFTVGGFKYLISRIKLVMDTTSTSRVKIS